MAADHTGYATELWAGILVEAGGTVAGERAEQFGGIWGIKMTTSNLTLIPPPVVRSDNVGLPARHVVVVHPHPLQGFQSISHLYGNDCDSRIDRLFSLRF